MSINANTPQPRRRRTDKYRGSGDTQARMAAPQRAGFPPEEDAPLPLGGYDAARPAENPAQRQAPRVYEDRVYQAQNADPRGFKPAQYEDEYADEEIPRRRWPWVVLALLLAAAVLFACSYFFIPREAGGILGSARSISHNAVDGGLTLLGLKKTEPPRLIKFETPADTVQTGVRSVFTFTASQAVDGVRIKDEVGTEITGVSEPVDSPDNTTWTLTAILDKPMTVTLSAELLKDNTWYQTDKFVQLVVAEPTATPAPTPLPTPVPTVPPTEAPVLVTEGALLPPPEGTIAPSTATQAGIFDPMGLLPAFTPNPQAGDNLSNAAATEPFQTSVPFEAPTEIPLQPATPALPEVSPEPMPLETAAAEEPQITEEPAVPEEPPVTMEPPQATAVPTPTFMPSLTLTAAEQQSPAAMGITEAAYQGNKRQDTYLRETPINVQGGEMYTYYPGGVFTFRSDGMRQNAAFGTAGMPLEQLSVKWQTELGSLRTSDSGTLYGLGWTGQPAIIKWSLEVRQMMNLNEAKKDVTALKEVIFAAQDGKVYFLDLADGQPTREAIDAGFPLKGSVAVDAIGRPMIAFGQGISKLPNKTGDIGFHIYNLIDQTKLSFINGRKGKNQLQYATNGAFDGTGLFDRQSDSLVVAGENGLLYTIKLNTVFDFRDAKTLTIDPEITYQRSKGNQNDLTVSMESSVAMYGPYAFIADKQGIIRAVDTTSMKTVWAFDAGDNTDATIALDLENESTLALYTGTTVFARTRRDGMAVIRRLDALTGEEVWAYKAEAGYDDTERGGVKASPVVGQGELGGLVFFTINKTPEGGSIVALDKATGALVWSLPLSAGAISSPVAVYADDGRGRIIQADLEGKLYLIEGLTGQVKHTLDLNGTIEGSPAVYNDVLVIGTMDSGSNSMYGIRIE